MSSLSGAKIMGFPKPASRWLVWLILSFISWCVGVGGYLAAGQSWWDAIVYALQLFSLRMPDLPRVPWLLHVARWSSAVLAVWLVLLVVNWCVWSLKKPASRLLLWLVLSGITWGFGVWGYLAADKSLANAVYHSLQLFTFQIPDLAVLPWPLELARWLSVILAGLAVLQGAFLLFFDAFQGLRAMTARRHVIVAGLGWRGRLFVQAFCRRGDTVVIVEKDVNNPYLDECRDLGAIPLLGDATEAEMLHRANVGRASVLLCLSDDGANLKTMLQAEKLLRQRSTKRPLYCYVHLDDLVICRNLRPMELRPSEIGFRPRFFSTFEVGAARMLPQGVKLADCARPPHLVIVGLEAMGESVLLEAIHQWRMRHPDHGSEKKPDQLRVTVVDEKADARWKSLQVRFPELDQFGDVKPVTWDEDSPQLDTCAFAFDAQGRTDVSAIYVCLEDDQLSLRTALRLNRRCQETGQRFPIIMQLVNNTDVGKLFQGPTFNLEEAQVKVFSLLENTCGPEYLRGVAERIARTIHFYYLWHKTTKGTEKLRSRPALYPWDELEEKFRKSNLDQAEHLPEILGRRGYRIVRLQSSQAETFTFPDDDLLKLAQDEHARYQGRKVASNPEKLQQNWDKLSKGDQDYTLDQVRIWPKILAKAGFEIQKMDGAGKSGAARQPLRD